MTDVAPVMSSQPKTRRRSIKTKFLVALLALALAPLILFVAITHSVMVDLREDVKAALIRQAYRDIGLLDKNQAVIATAMLEKVEAETQMAAFFARALVRDPALGQIDPIRRTRNRKTPPPNMFWRPASPWPPPNPRWT